MRIIWHHLGLQNWQANMETIFKNPGLWHIGKQICSYLDVKTIGNLTSVSQGCKRFLHTFFTFDFFEEQLKTYDFFLKRNFKEYGEVRKYFKYQTDFCNSLSALYKLFI